MHTDWNDIPRKGRNVILVLIVTF